MHVKTIFIAHFDMFFGITTNEFAIVHKKYRFPKILYREVPLGFNNKSVQ